MLTKSEFCQFSLRGKIRLLDEFGRLLLVKTFDRRTILVFKLYTFYVEVVYQDNIPEIAEPISSDMLGPFYENN